MRAHPWKIAAVAGVLSVLGYFLVVSHELARETLWRLTILGACTAILVGVRVHRHDRRHPWFILFTALALIGVANLLTYPVWVQPWAQPVADLLSAVAFPLIGLGALAIFRLQVPGGDRESAVDGLIVMVAMATVLTGTVFHPGRLGQDVSVAAMLLNTVAPLVMAAVTAATCRLLFVGTVRVPSAWLIVLASASGLFGNTMRAFATAEGVYARGYWGDVFILLTYVTVGLACLHPSSPQLTRPVERLTSRFTHARLAILGLSLLAGPVTLLLQGIDLVLPLAASVLLTLLVLWRLGHLVVERERARQQLHQRAERQEALAALARRALDDDDLPALVDDAAQALDRLVELPVAVVDDAAAERGAAATVVPLAADGPALVVTGETDAEDRAFIHAVAAVVAGAIERQATQELLVRQAVYDGLTGLPNRELLLDRLSQQLAGCRRQGTVLAVMFVDLDGFKRINDDHGHEAGDELLVAVAGRLAGTVRATDTVGRLAGDEFVVVSDQADADGGRQLAGRISAALEEPYELGGSRITVSASIGLVVTDGTATDAERLLAQADAAMYEAKRRPGGTVARYDERVDDERRRRRRIERELERGLGRGELTLDYQPLIRPGAPREARVVGVEALARWRTADGRMVPPGVFIPVAESSDLILRLGDHVVQAACTQLAEWEQRLGAGEEFSCFVNLASRQLADTRLPERVAAILAATGVTPGRLGFEVAETAVLDERAIAVATELSRLGVRLALDDFGVGYTSIAHLKRLPLDLIKLDGSLVVGATRQPEDRAIVAAVATIAHELGIQVLAEQVETEEQLHTASELGCELIQGYLLARPDSPDRVRLPSGGALVSSNGSRPVG